MSERARSCYEAFHARGDGKFAAWDHLPAEEQLLWDGAAEAVERRFAEQFRLVIEAMWRVVQPVVASAAQAVSHMTREPDDG
jgi:hypothetical protein